jgi:hypothetical protein
VPYREKTAWLSLIGMAITFGPYFVLAAIHAQPATALPDVHELVIFAVAAVAYALIVAVGTLVLYRKEPQDARAPLDERDLAIQRRSMSIAYYILMIGMVEVGVVMPFNAGGWKIIHAALFMIVAADLVRYGVVVFSYRRQAA